MKTHILTVDDEPDIREILKLRLGFEGYRVSAVGTAEEARRIAKEDPPQLAIADLQMEDTDGLALIEELRKIVPNLPVILLTGVIFDPEVVREKISKLVTSYLDKTASLDRVVVEVHRLLHDAGTSASAAK